MLDAACDRCTPDEHDMKRPIRKGPTHARIRPAQWNELLVGVAQNVAATSAAAAFIALGMGVIVGRSLFDVARHSWEKRETP